MLHSAGLRDPALMKVVVTLLCPFLWHPYVDAIGGPGVYLGGSEFLDSNVAPERHIPLLDVGYGLT